MNRLAVMGWGVVSPAGETPSALADTVRAGAAVPADVRGMYPEPLPSDRAYALVDFNVRAELGRKGTSFFDRRTALTVVACRRALSDAGLSVGDGNRHRIGVVLGTTVGSARSSVDYAVETFTQDPPYMVNPALFPNTVMNCAAGQSAIWFGFNGINATVAGGPLALLSVLRYCANAFGGDQADHLLAGAVEEYTPHSAWMSHRNRSADPVPAGEGGAVFVLAPHSAPGRRDGEVLAVALGFCPEDQDRSAALTRCVSRAMRGAGVDADDVWLAATGPAADRREDRARWEAVRAALGTPSTVERLRVEELTGDCQAATGALELATVLALHREDAGRDGRVSVLAACGAEGGVGAAVVRGWSRGADRG
jgi:3-oxoacyl-[acyl-carrier-protein] synthase II